MKYQNKSNQIYTTFAPRFTSNFKFYKSGMSVQKVQVRWRGGMQLKSEGPGGDFLMDAAKEVGGQDKGLRPKALMLSALGGCAGVDIALLLKKMHAQVAHFEIEIIGELTETLPEYYHKVQVIFKFYDKAFQKKKIEKAVALSTEKYCGVMAMFKKFAEVQTEIRYIHS